LCGILGSAQATSLPVGVMYLPLQYQVTGAAASWMTCSAAILLPCIILQKRAASCRLSSWNDPKLCNRIVWENSRWIQSKHSDCSTTPRPPCYGPWINSARKLF